MLGSAQQKLQEFDDHIRLLEKQLADLKEERNSLASSLCRIPEEILVDILEYQQHDIEPDSMKIWVQSIAVCRRVWNVALRWPQLWSTHYIDSASDDVYGDQQWLNICHGRGGQHGLTLYADNDLIPSQANRFARTTSVLYVDGVGLMGGADGLSTPQSAQPLQGWPMLRHLNIKGYRLSRGMKIQSNLLGGYSTSLASMSLSNGYYPLDSFPDLPGLRHLHIMRLGLETEHAFTKIRQFLSRSKHLSSLDLDIRLPDSPSQRFTIPIVSQATLDSDGSSGMTLSLVSVKLTATPEVSCAILDMVPDSLQELWVFMWKHYSSPEQERVIARALRFLHKMAASSPSRFEYQVNFTCDRYELFFEVTSIQSAAQTRRYSPLQLSATCQHRSSLREILRYARKVTFGMYADFDRAFSALEQSASTPKELHFTSTWNNRWGRLPMIERYLKSRKDQAQPLAILRIDQATGLTGDVDASIDIADSGIAARWLSEGLIGELFLPTGQFLSKGERNSESGVNEL